MGVNIEKLNEKMTDIKSKTNIDHQTIQYIEIGCKLGIQMHNKGKLLLCSIKEKTEE